MSIATIKTSDLVAVGLYDSEAAVVQDAMRYLFQSRPELRIEFAVRQYESDHEMSLAKASSLGGISLERMKEVLSHHRVPLRLGVSSLKEALDEVETARR